MHFKFPFASPWIIERFFLTVATKCKLVRLEVATANAAVTMSVQVTLTNIFNSVLWLKGAKRSTSLVLGAPSDTVDCGKSWKKGIEWSDSHGYSTEALAADGGTSEYCRFCVSEDISNNSICDKRRIPHHSSARRVLLVASTSDKDNVLILNQK